jgi:hypothetical protein
MTDFQPLIACARCFPSASNSSRTPVSSFQPSVSHLTCALRPAWMSFSVRAQFLLDPYPLNDKTTAGGIVRRPTFQT